MPDDVRQTDPPERAPPDSLPSGDEQSVDRPDTNG
jgi:hypothetical protein